MAEQVRRYESSRNNSLDKKHSATRFRYGVGLDWSIGQIVYRDELTESKYVHTVRPAMEPEHAPGDFRLGDK
jgi:hypothetical protein